MSLNRTIAWSTTLNDIQAANRIAAPVYVVAGKFDMAAIMRSAVSIARRFGSSCQLDWQGRMRLGLRTAWKRAKEAMAEVVTAPAPKMALDRPATIALLTRIQNRACNHNRDILTITGFMPSLSEVLQHARSEYRHLSAADRAAVMVGSGASL